jgi:hypothetical protein
MKFKNQIGVDQTHYVHLVQRRGQEGTSLLHLTVPAEAKKDLEIDLIYPADATPPQVLTVFNGATGGVFEAEAPPSPAPSSLSQDF